MLYFIEDYYKVDLLLYIMAWTSCLDIERAQYELAMTGRPSNYPIDIDRCKCTVIRIMAHLHQGLAKVILLFDP